MERRTFVRTHRFANKPDAKHHNSSKFQRNFAKYGYSCLLEWAETFEFIVHKKECARKGKGGSVLAGEKACRRANRHLNDRKKRLNERESVWTTEQVSG